MAYVIQMLLFRVASSPYFNMSLLTSDFYGLLFGTFPYAQFSCSYHVLNPSSGLFLFVSHGTLPRLIPPISRTAALFALLAVLCRIRNCDLGAYCLFLVCNP